MCQKIVCQANVRRYYGDNAELLERYKVITESGKCPFCEPFEDMVCLGRTTHWRIVKNNYPYQNAQEHHMAIPARHICSLAEMTPEEWSDMANVLTGLLDFHPVYKKGYGLALRDGEVGGVTLYHLHFHLIAPAIGEHGQIPVNFGIG